MKTILLGLLLCTIILAVGYYVIHPREVVCCQRPVDVLGNAQELHAAGDNPAMCRQRGGNVIWVDELYVGCSGGNVVGETH